MTNDFAVKYIWACAVGFISRLAGEIFLFKIVKMNLSKSRQKKKEKKKLPKLSDQTKYILPALSANTFLSNQIKDSCK